MNIDHCQHGASALDLNDSGPIKWLYIKDKAYLKPIIALWYGEKITTGGLRGVFRCQW